MKSANVGLTPRNDKHEEVLPKVADALSNAKRVLCVLHPGPDGDAAGSSLGLGLALRERGKDVTFFCTTDLPYNLGILSGLAPIVREIPAEASFDATVICDVGSSKRVGPGLPPKERRGIYVNIDHHLTSDDFGDINYVDADAAAVGVLIHRILKTLGHPLSKPVATALYVSVLTDTGSFRYSSTNPEALRVTADLVQAGADPWEISSSIYEQQPVERFHLLREVLNTLHVSPDGLFACITVSHAMKEATRSRSELTDGFINFARSIRGVEVAAQLSEPAPGSGDPWYISFRSLGKANVAGVSAEFGGGGHHNAAGCSISGSQDEVQQKVGEAVRREMARALQRS